MATEKRKHRLTIEERRRGQAAGAATRRAKREEERALLAEARAEHLDEAIETLSGIAKKAADAIDHLLDADSEAVRLRAAETVIQILVDVEVLEMSDRLSRLEELAAGRNGKP
jgi:hypothetical protein